MANDTNVVGETMEPRIIVTIVQNMEGRVLNISTSIGGRIVSEGVLQALIGSPMDQVKAVATVYSNLSYTPEALLLPSTDKTRNFDTIRAVEHTFTYLDCGRWGGDPLRGGQRSFGLIWGQWAALCEFVSYDNKIGAYDPQDAPRVPDTDGNGLNEFFLEATRGGLKLKLVRSVCSNTRMSFYNKNVHGQPVNLDYNTVYVILPDFHLPIVTRTPKDLDTNAQGDGLLGNGRIGLNVFTPFDLMKPGYTHLGTNEYGYPFRGPSCVTPWNARYREGDIFLPAGTGSLRAERDLSDFLAGLRTIKLPNGKVTHLVQVGDMYDLWIGLGRFFDEAKDAVRLRSCEVDYNLKRHTLTAEDFIDYWIDQTNKNFPDMMAAFSKFSGPKTFLYGNHDNYLAQNTGYAARNHIDQRVKHIRKNGHFIEHGHRGDSSNRDGATSGHLITQGVHYLKLLRAVDPDRRAAFATTAALAFIGSPDFFVYAMGHTHSPYLTQVTIRTIRAPLF